MASELGKQTIAIHTFPNISKTEGSETLKLGQLIEYNINHIFLEKSSTKCGVENIPRPFSTKSTLSISLDQWSKVLCSSFLLHAKLRAIEILLKLSCRPFAFNSCRVFFKKAKRHLEVVSLPHFMHDFWMKIFLLLYCINWPNFNFWLPLLRKVLDNMCIVIAC